MIYADLECLLEKIHSCQNIPEISYTEKKAMQTHSGYSMFTHCSFVSTKSKLHCYRGKDCMEWFCKDLKKHVTKIINYDKKEMITLTDKENKFYEKQKVSYICKKGFSTDDDGNKKYQKVRDHCHYTGKFRGVAPSICNLRNKTPKKIPVVFHIRSTYDSYFIVKQLAKEFNGRFECLEENTEKYITFSVPIEKELDNAKTNAYKLKLIDSFRFMSIYNISEIYSKECKGCESVCDFIRIKNNKLHYKCNECKKIQLKPINELIKKFPNIYQFCNGDINKFVLLILMNTWIARKYSLKHHYLIKKAFYNELYLEDITDEDYTYAQKVFKDFNLKNLGEYYDLYVQSHTLLLADVFEDFRNKCIEICELDLPHFLSAP